MEELIKEYIRHIKKHSTIRTELLEVIHKAEFLLALRTGTIPVFHHSDKDGVRMFNGKYHCAICQCKKYPKCLCEFCHPPDRKTHIILDFRGVDPNCGEEQFKRILKKVEEINVSIVKENEPVKIESQPVTIKPSTQYFIENPVEVMEYMHNYATIATFSSVPEHRAEALKHILSLERLFKHTPTFAKNAVFLVNDTVTLNGRPLCHLCQCNTYPFCTYKHSKCPSCFSTILDSNDHNDMQKQSSNIEPYVENPIDIRNGQVYVNGRWLCPYCGCNNFPYCCRTVESGQCITCPYCTRNGIHIAENPALPPVGFIPPVIGGVYFGIQYLGLLAWITQPFWMRMFWRHRPGYIPMIPGYPMPWTYPWWRPPRGWIPPPNWVPHQNWRPPNYWRPPVTWNPTGWKPPTTWKHRDFFHKIRPTPKPIIPVKPPTVGRGLITPPGGGMIRYPPPKGGGMVYRPPPMGRGFSPIKIR